MITILYDIPVGQYKIMIIKWPNKTLDLIFYIRFNFNPKHWWEELDRYSSNINYEFYINSAHIELITILQSSVDYFTYSNTIDGFVFRLTDHGKLELL